MKSSYSQRRRRGPLSRPLELGVLRRLYGSWARRLDREQLLDQQLGKECPDEPRVGIEIFTAELFVMTGREVAWPPMPDEDLDQDTILDVVEALHGLVAAGVDGTFHNYAGCGTHFETFDEKAGQTRWRAIVEPALRRLDPPLTFADDGFLHEDEDPGFQQLIHARLPPHVYSASEVDVPVEHAIRTFSLRGATKGDQRDAVVTLAGVLERLRVDVLKEAMPADEADLFRIANGFALRHNNANQRRDYTSAVWLRWCFYVYLATIHAALRLSARHRSSRHGGDGDTSSVEIDGFRDSSRRKPSIGGF